MKSEQIALKSKPESVSWWKKFLMDWDQIQIAISFLIVAFVAVAPLFVHSPYYLGILILASLYSFIGISWNLISGYAGQILIAHVIFVAVGAYTTIVLFNTFGVTPWLGLWVSGLTAGLLGLLMALITLRYGLKADYFALFTIALMVALKTLFLKWDFVGGAVGMGLSLSKVGFSNMIFRSKVPYLYIALALLVAGIIVQYLIVRSKTGKYFMAIREDEDAAAALGVNTSFYKTLAVVIGAVMAGIGGGVYVMYVTFVEPPQVFDLGLNVEIVLAAPIIGGLGSLAGPILGGFLNKPLAEILRGLLSAERAGTSLIVYGSFLVLSILFMPRGLTGVLHDLYIKWQQRGTREAGVPKRS